MGPQSGTSSLRRVRTFADDMRRAEGDTTKDTSVRTTATSVVAPTIRARSDVTPPALLNKEAPAPSVEKNFFGNLSEDLMDIRTAEHGTNEATIVSERKVKKWSFTDALQNSMRSWWRDTVSEIKSDIAAATPKQLPTQPLPERRSRIVRASVPTPPPAQPAPTPQATASEPARWTHAETPPEPAPKVARPILRPEAATTVPSRISALENIPQPIETISTPPAPAAPLRSGIDDAVATSEIDVTLAAREAAIREESAKFAARAREAALRRKEYEATQEEPRGNGSKYFVYGTLGVIALSLIVIVASAGYALFGRNTPVVEAPKPGLSMLFAVSDSLSLPLLSDRTSLMVNITKTVSEARGELGSLIRINFFYPSDESETPLPTQAFIDALDLRAPGSMLRTILSTSMFGMYLDTENAPFLVLKVRNFEDALGGMLLFEKNMNSDLAPVFGENLERIGEPSTFRDEVVGGIDARTLYDSYGTMHMTYAFIDRETIVITTSYTALGALAQVLK